MVINGGPVNTRVRDMASLMASLCVQGNYLSVKLLKDVTRVYSLFVSGLKLHSINTTLCAMAAVLCIRQQTQLDINWLVKLCAQHSEQAASPAHLQYLQVGFFWQEQFIGSCSQTRTI